MELKLKSPIATLGNKEKRIELSLFKTAKIQKRKSVQVPKTKRLTRTQINKISDYKYKLVNYIEELEAKTADANEVKKLKAMRKDIVAVVVRF